MTTFLPAQTIQALFERFHAQLEIPQTELEYEDPYTLLVATVLSARCTDKAVNAATPALFAQARTPAAMVALGVEGVMPLIATLGLYKNKARFLIRLSEQLLERHGGEVPDDQEALESLAGVGRKTASVVRNVAFGVPTLPVDTHVFRVSRRLGLSDGATPQAVERDLWQCIPPMWLGKAHHWLVLHGRYVCKAIKPRCSICPIKDLCLLWKQRQKKIAP